MLLCCYKSADRILKTLTRQEKANSSLNAPTWQFFIFMQCTPTTNLRDQYGPTDFNQTKTETKDSLPSSTLIEYDNLQDQFLAQLQAEKRLDNDLWIQDVPLHPPPALGKNTLIKIVKLLSDPISSEVEIIPHQAKFKAKFNLCELISDLDKYSQIEKTELVGGIVFWLLKDFYLKEFLTALGINNLELLPELIKGWEAMPNDIDVRIHLPKISKKSLKNSKKRIDQFIAGRLGDEILRQNCASFVNYLALSNKAHDQCYNKRHTEYSENNHYSIVTLKNPNIELLIIEELSNLSLFIRDALRLNISPLIQAFIKYQNPDKLIEDIENDKISLKIIPESDFHNIWQVIVDRLTCIVRADKNKYKKINEGGWPILMSLISKGHTCVDEDLESTLLDTFRGASNKYRGMLEAPLFWLKKILRNHHPKYFLDAFTLTFNGCKSLNKSEEIASLWNGMRFYFNNSSHPIVQTIDALMIGGVDFNEILALLQAKAFLHLQTENKDPFFQISLPSVKHEQIVKINLGGSYLQIPFDPINALRILSNSKNEQIIDLIQSFVCPSDPYVSGKKLQTEWIELEKIADKFANNVCSLANELRLVSSIRTPDKIKADLFVDDLHHMLLNPRLKDSIQHLPLSSFPSKILLDYEELMNDSSRTPELNIALAFARSNHPAYIQKGYSLFQSCHSNSPLKHVFIKALAPARPDLAMNILLSLELTNHSSLLNSWMIICNSCQSREHIFRAADLPFLLKGLLKLFPENPGAPRIIAPKNFLIPFRWVCRALEDQDETDSMIDLLRIATPENFEPEAGQKLCQFWLGLCEKISNDPKEVCHLSRVWKLFKALELDISAETASQYQNVLLSVAQNFQLEKSLLNDLFKEKFAAELHENAKSIVIVHLENAIRRILKKKDFEEASATLEMIAGSEFDFTKELEKQVFSLFKIILKNETGLPLAAKLLSNPKFEAFFQKKDFFFIRFLFLDEALSVNPQKYFNEIRRHLKINLDYIETTENQLSCFLKCAKFLIKFLEIHDLSSMPLIKRSINASIGKFFQALHKKNFGSDIVQLSTLMSLQKCKNRLEWLEQSLPELSRHAPSSVCPTILSLGDLILSSNPDVNEIRTLLNLYQHIEKPPANIWANLMEIIYSTKNHELQVNACDVLFNFLEKKCLLSSHPQHRAQCWLSCLKGLELFSDKRIITVFENVELFLEVFDPPLSNIKYEDVLKIIFNCLKNAFEGTRASLNQYQDVFSSLTQFLKILEKQDSQELYDSVSLTAQEFLAGSDDKRILQDSCQKLTKYLADDKPIDAVQNSFFICVDNILKFKILEEGPLWDKFKGLVESVKEKGSLSKFLIPLIQTLGTHTDTKVVIEGILIFKDVLHRKLNQKNQKQLIGPGILLLKNAIHHHFNAATSCLLSECLKDSLMRPFFHDDQYPSLLSSYINQTYLPLPTIFYPWIFKELNDVINLVRQNLQGLRYNSEQQNNAIKIVFEIIYQLTIKNESFEVDIINNFFQNLISYYSHHFCTPNYSKRKNSNSILYSGDDSKELTKIKYRICEWKMYFFNKLLDHFSKEIKANPHLINIATQWFEQFKYSKRINLAKYSTLRRKYKCYLKKHGVSTIKENNQSLIGKIFVTARNFLFTWTCAYSLNRVFFPYVYELNKTYPLCFDVPSAVSSYTLLTHKIENLIPSPFGFSAKLFIIRPIFNEYCYRFALQEILLKRIPKKLLKKFAPSSKPLVNSIIAKVARVAITSVIFTLAQIYPDNSSISNQNCSLIQIINIFGVGLILGAIQECFGKTYLAAASHMAFTV